MSRAKRLSALAVAGLVALMPAHTKTAVAARHLGDIDLITAGVIEEGSLARSIAVASESSGTAPFAANEGAPTSNAPTITATITDASQLPVTRTGVMTTQEGTPVGGTLQATSPNGLPLTFALTTTATKGTAVLTDAATGAFTYTPQAGAYGYDTFTFTATDAIGTSAPVVEMVFIVAASAQFPGTIARVSIASDGTDGNGESGNSVLSADGRYVAFTSLADNLVAGDANGTADIFVRDRLTNTTTLVSVNASGEQGNSVSMWPAMTPDGRYIVFESYADNLVDGDTNGVCDVFMHDRMTAETTRVSVASNGSQAIASSCSLDTAPAVSADGRFVAFESVAANLTGNSNGLYQQVFVRDRLLGQTTLVSLDNFGFPADGGSMEPSLSADGRYVAFTSAALNLDPDTGRLQAQGDVFVHDRSNGFTSTVSVSAAGKGGNLYSYAPQLSADGRYVAFRSLASNLVPGDNNTFEDVFVRDLLRGETTRVSVATDGTEGDGWTPAFSMSPDGRYVLFASTSRNLVPGDQNSGLDLFLRDLATGETHLMAALGDSGNETLSLSADGRVATVDSLADNLVPNDRNAFRDVFVVERAVAAAPVAIDAFVTTAEDTAAAGTLTASDPGGLPVTFTLLTTGALGTATLTNELTGTYTYTPANNVFGTDTFTFKANNGAAGSNVATVTVTITPVNDAPVAQDDVLVVTAGASATATLVASDVDSPTLTYAIVASATKGTVTITDPATGAYEYTANTDASGSDAFTFTAADGTLSSNVATITITITTPRRLREPEW